MQISETLSVVYLQHHPAPWRVEYKPQFEEWHPRSCPCVLDANGEWVVAIPQSPNVGHPGLHDVNAELLAMAIAESVNTVAAAERCPQCGYTREDCRNLGDHKLCDAYPFFADEKTRHISVPRELIVAADSELSAVGHGRPVDKEESLRISSGLRKCYEPKRNLP